MNSHVSLTSVFQNAETIHFTNQDKFVLFSDCHRGDKSFSDDFLHNKHIYNYALNYYFENGYSYIELGDGDELWENRDFETIYSAHEDTFHILKKFEKSDRLILLYGNHDIDWKNEFNVKFLLNKIVYEHLQVREAVCLVYDHNMDQQLFLVHGHQVDRKSDKWWKFSRFMVRHVWRHLQKIGFNDPTSPAKNYRKRNKVETQLMEWSRANQVPLIAGHTHRPRIPTTKNSLYFNTGSCVHPDCICGIEIKDGKINTVKWAIRPDSEGVMKIMAKRENERPIATLFESSSQPAVATTAPQ